MSAASLERALRAAGVPCRVEARAQLALLVPDDAALDVADAALRRRVAAMLAEHGFTHVALEVVEDAAATPDDGARRAAHPAPAPARAAVPRD